MRRSRVTFAMIEAAAIEADFASPLMIDSEGIGRRSSGTASMRTSCGAGCSEKMASYMPLIVA